MSDPRQIYHTREREVKEKRKVLFPIRLVSFEAHKDWQCFDADTGKGTAREIREFFIPDFSEWKDHDRFEAGFKRLLADLKAESRKCGVYPKLLRRIERAMADEEATVAKRRASLRARQAAGRDCQHCSALFPLVGW